MKKFSFTLESVYKYKLTVEKKQKADLKEAQARLRALREEEARLDAAHERNTLSLRRVLEEGKDIPVQMARHDAFFRYLREAKAELMERIVAAEAEKERRQNLLIGTMKEIKVYEKLKEEQYRRYLEEVAQEEAKEMSDLVSFKTIRPEEA